jgi:hypothetical protein
MKTLHLATLVFVCTVSPLFAIDYYVDTVSGNDSNNGRSPTAAWKSLSKVNANNVSFTAGDTVNFKSGQTFTGGPLLVRHNGTAAAPIVFRVYDGTAKAVIQTTSTTANGINLGSGRKHVVLQDLLVTGPWSYTGTGAYNPVGIIGTGAYENLDLHRIEVTGFQGYGIYFENTTNTPGTGLTIMDTSVHHVGCDGIRVRGAWNASTRQINHRDVYIGYCVASYCKGYNSVNSSGSGIQFAQVDGALIEYCEAHNTGSGWGGNGGGPIGIWSWDSNNVVIQHCYSHHNKNGNGSWDGGGFDIDGGDTNCVIQYCYSHDNDGPGYFLAHFGDSHPTNNNVIRYNISQNDSRASAQGAINVWGAVSNSYLHNNVVIGGNASGELVVRESSGSGIKFFNNLVVATGGNPVLRSAASGAIEYRHNAWWNTTGIAPAFSWSGTTYSGLAAWRAASGQETHLGSPTGLQTDPNLENIAGGPTSGWSATRLTEVTAYLLKSFSPLRDAGLDPAARYGLSAGPRDYYGNTLPQNGAYDIGLHETTAAPVTSPPAAPSNLQTFAIAPRWVDLTWADGSTNESGFWIERSADSGSSWQHAATVGMNVTSYSDQSLVPATTYLYRVRAYNVAGFSAFSPTSSVTTPGTGGNLALAGSISGFSNQQLGYEAYRAIDGIDNNDENRWSASGYPQWIEIDLGADKTITGTELVSALGRTYKFRVEAKPAGGTYSTILDRTANTDPSPVSDIFAAVTARYVKLTVTGAHNYTGGWVSIREFKVWGSDGAPQAPVAPSALSATALSSSEVSLGWSDNSTNENGFTIEYRVGTGTWQTHSTRPAGSTTATISGLAPSTTYSFRVAAYNDGGSSAWSNEATATTAPSGGGTSTNLATAGTVSAFSAQQTGNEAVKLIDGIDNTDSNRWSASGYPNWVEIDLGADKTVTATEFITYQSRIYKYKVEARSTSGAYALVVDRTTNTTLTPTVDTLAAPFTARYVRLTVTGAHNYTGGWVSVRELKVLGY